MGVIVVLVAILIETAAEVNIQGGLYGNALSAASSGGFGRTVEVLLDCGADVNAIGHDDETALQAASLNGHERVVSMLLERGAIVNATEAEMNAKVRRCINPLRACWQEGCEGFISMMLEASGGHMVSESRRSLCPSPEDECVRQTEEKQ